MTGATAGGADQFHLRAEPPGTAADRRRRRLHNVQECVEPRSGGSRRGRPLISPPPNTTDGDPRTAVSLRSPCSDPTRRPRGGDRAPSLRRTDPTAADRLGGGQTRLIQLHGHYSAGDLSLPDIQCSELVWRLRAALAERNTRVRRLRGRG